MNRPFSRETENELLRAAEAHPGQGLVLGADGVARPVEAAGPGPDWAVLGPKLAAALRIIDANAAESVEWIRRHTREALALMPASA